MLERVRVTLIDRGARNLPEGHQTMLELLCKTSRIILFSVDVSLAQHPAVLASFQRHAFAGISKAFALLSFVDPDVARASWTAYDPLKEVKEGRGKDR